MWNYALGTKKGPLSPLNYVSLQAKRDWLNKVEKMNTWYFSVIFPTIRDIQAHFFRSGRNLLDLL